MNPKEELIVIHIQNGYMDDIKYQKVRTTLLEKVNVSVKLFEQHGKVNFFLDYLHTAGESAIEIDNKKPNVKTYMAPAGDAREYKLNSNLVTLTGLWIGACVNNGIISVVRAFFQNPKLYQEYDKLTIFLPGNGICKPNKLLDDMYAEPVETTFLRGFDYDTSKAFFKKTTVIQDRGLTVDLIRKHKDPAKKISKSVMIVPPSEKPSGPMFRIELFFN
jgi:hypothetical protein